MDVDIGEKLAEHVRNRSDTSTYIILIIASFALFYRTDQRGIVYKALCITL